VIGDLKIYRFIIIILTIVAVNNPLTALSMVKDEHLKTSDGSSETGKSAQQAELSYSIEPFYDIDIFRLIVVMEFTGDKSGETKIILPSNFASSSDINGIKYLKPLSANTVINESDKPEIKIVKHAPNSLVRIYYQVEEVRNNDIDLGNQNMATIRRQFIHFLGETFFIVPGWDSNIDFNIRLAWNHMPSNWNLANSFGINEKLQEIRLPLWKFKRSLFAAGDFRIIKKWVANNPIYLAVRGTLKFTDNELADLYANITKTERDFWSDNNFPYFLLTVQPLEGSNDQIGVLRTNAYALFLSQNRMLDIRLKRLIAHEIFHIWVGDKIQFADPEQLVYWFKEGFTEYYTDLLLLRSKLMTLEEYVDQYNVILETYFTSSMRYEKNERLINEYWSDKDLTRLPFQRGRIFAQNLNYTILKNSNWKKSLDDFMRDLISRCLNESLVISNGSLSSLIRFYAGDQILSDIMRTLNSGAVLKTIPEALGPCFKMEIESKKKLIIFGEQYDIPSYQFKNENQQIDKSCLDWFGVN